MTFALHRNLYDAILQLLRTGERALDIGRINFKRRRIRHLGEHPIPVVSRAGWEIHALPARIAGKATAAACLKHASGNATGENRFDFFERRPSLVRVDHSSVAAQAKWRGGQFHRDRNRERASDHRFRRDERPRVKVGATAPSEISNARDDRSDGELRTRSRHRERFRKRPTAANPAHSIRANYIEAELRLRPGYVRLFEGVPDDLGLGERTRSAS